MAKQTGRAMLVKIGDGQSTEVFSTLCGLTSKTLTVNNNTYDVTTADCAAPGGQLWTELQTGARSVSVSGNGIFEGGTSLDRFIAVAFGASAADTDNAICNFEIIVPEFGTFSGAFHIDSAEYGGEQEGAATYSTSLSSSGYVTFTAD